MLAAYGQLQIGSRRKRKGYGLTQSVGSAYSYSHFEILTSDGGSMTAFFPPSAITHHWLPYVSDNTCRCRTAGGAVSLRVAAGLSLARTLCVAGSPRLPAASLVAASTGERP